MSVRFGEACAQAAGGWNGLFCSLPSAPRWAGLSSFVLRSGAALGRARRGLLTAGRDGDGDDEGIRDLRGAITGYTGWDIAVRGNQTCEEEADDAVNPGADLA